MTMISLILQHQFCLAYVGMLRLQDSITKYKMDSLHSVDNQQLLEQNQKKCAVSPAAQVLMFH